MSIVLISSDMDMPLNPYKRLGLIDFLLILFFLVCGGAYGIEELGGSLPPLYVLIAIVVCPWFIAFPLALATAELASAMPVQEGFVFWTEKAWGRMIGFFEGWLVVLVVMIDKALYPVIFMAYLEVVLVTDFPFWGKLLTNSLFVLICFFLAILGPKWLGHITKVFTFGIIVPMAIFTLLCFIDPRTEFKRWLVSEVPENYNYWDSTQLFSSVLLWLYSGYDFSGFLADEIKNPSSAYPKVMLISVVFNMFVYLLPVAAALAFTDDKKFFREGSFILIARALNKEDWLSYLLLVGSLFSNMGVYLVYIHTSSNALCSLAEKGDAPSAFSRRSYYFHTPWVAIFFFSITTVLWTLFDFSVLIEVETILYCFHVIILVTTFIKLRISFPDMERPYRVPGPLRFLVLCTIPPLAVVIANIVMSDWFKIVISVALVLMVVICYFIRDQYLLYTSVK